MELVVSMATSLASSSSSLRFRGGVRDQQRGRRRFSSCLITRAIKAPEECNEEECAPTKEVGSLSMEWKAEENTKVIGTFPPVTKQNRFTGYVEKDSAGQANIYAVEPPVYVGESAVSTGSAGASSEGSASTVAIVAGLGVVTAAAVAVILSNEPGPKLQQEQPELYSGPPLTYYIDKFQPVSVQVQVQEAALITEQAPVDQSERAP